jgi:type IV pilus assembly protein PilA
MAPRSKMAKGFTLSELLVVLVLVILLAAIALPNLLRSQIAANETAAIESLAKINKAEIVYQTTYPAVGFASTLETLGPGTPDDKCKEKAQAHACLIEGVLARAGSPTQTHSGYWFTVVPTTRDSGGVITGYVAAALPAILDKTGSRNFCSQEDAVIRFSAPQAGTPPPGSAPECAAMTILQ